VEARRAEKRRTAGIVAPERPGKKSALAKAGCGDQRCVNNIGQDCGTASFCRDEIY